MSHSSSDRIKLYDNNGRLTHESSMPRDIHISVIAIPI